MGRGTHRPFLVGAELRAEKIEVGRRGPRSGFSGPMAAEAVGGRAVVGQSSPVARGLQIVGVFSPSERDAVCRPGEMCYFPA